MRKIIEYTLVSADGVFEDPGSWDFFSFRDDAYLRDGLGLMAACDGTLMGRTGYESGSKLWPSRKDPWASRLNEIRKYVFSSKLDKLDWNNSTLTKGDVVAEVTKLKNQPGGDLFIWGHGLLAQTLLDHRLTDVIDLSIHPVIVGRGKQLFREGFHANLKLVASKTFSKIVKLTYEPQYK